MLEYNHFVQLRSQAAIIYSFRHHWLALFVCRSWINLQIGFILWSSHQPNSILFHRTNKEDRVTDRHSKGSLFRWVNIRGVLCKEQRFVPQTSNYGKISDFKIAWGRQRIESGSKKMNKLCLSCNVSSVSKIFYGEAIRSKSLNQELQIVQNRVFHVIFGFGISLRQLGVLLQL